MAGTVAYVSTYLRRLDQLAETESLSPRAHALLNDIVRLLLLAASGHQVSMPALAAGDSTAMHLRALGRLAERSFGISIPVDPPLAARLDAAIYALLME